MTKLLSGFLERLVQSEQVAFPSGFPPTNSPKEPTKTEAAA